MTSAQNREESNSQEFLLNAFMNFLK